MLIIDFRLLIFEHTYAYMCVGMITEMGAEGNKNNFYFAQGITIFEGLICNFTKIRILKGQMFICLLFMCVIFWMHFINCCCMPKIFKMLMLIVDFWVKDTSQHAHFATTTSQRSLCATPTSHQDSSRMDSSHQDTSRMPISHQDSSRTTGSHQDGSHQDTSHHQKISKN